MTRQCKCRQKESTFNYITVNGCFILVNQTTKFCSRDCKRSFEKSIRQWAYNEHARDTLNLSKLQHSHSLETEKYEE
jgi:hypothetical protein